MVFSHTMHTHHRCVKRETILSAIMKIAQTDVISNCKSHTQKPHFSRQWLLLDKPTCSIARYYSLSSWLLLRLGPSSYSALQTNWTIGLAPFWNGMRLLKTENILSSKFIIKCARYSLNSLCISETSGLLARPLNLTIALSTHKTVISKESLIQIQTGLSHLLPQSGLWSGLC